MISRTRLSDEFLPELNAMELEQDPIHRHKDVLTHTIAVVGLSSKPDRPSFGVAGYLQDHGYRILPVNPNE